MKISRSAAVLIASLSLVCCTSAFGQDKLKIVTEEFAPFNYTDHGKVTGYATQVVEELLRRAGMPYELNSYPWSRSYKMAQSLPNVLIYSLARTPDREDSFIWIGALAKRKLYLYKLATRKDIQVQSLDDAKKYWISVNRDDAAEKLLLDRGFTFEKNLDLSPSDVSSLSKLLAGRIDFVTGSDYTVGYLLDQAGVERSRVQRSLALIDQGEYYIAASKSTSPETVKRLRQAYEQMEKDGVIKGMQPKLD